MAVQVCWRGFDFLVLLAQCPSNTLLCVPALLLENNLEQCVRSEAPALHGHTPGRCGMVETAPTTVILSYLQESPLHQTLPPTPPPPPWLCGRVRRVTGRHCTMLITSLSPLFFRSTIWVSASSRVTPSPSSWST